jgi:phosphate transport system permease protein
MSDLVQDAKPTSEAPFSRPLAGARLPRWSPAAIAAVAVAAGCGIGAAAGW